MVDKVLMGLIRVNRHRLRHLREETEVKGCMHLILFYVRRTPGASQDEITAFYALDKTSVARDCQKLEDRGWLRRETDPCNRRRNCLYLTEAGIAEVTSLDEHYERYAQRLRRGFSDAEWETLLGFLERLEKNSEKESE